MLIKYFPTKESMLTAFSVLRKSLMGSNKSDKFKDNTDKLHYTMKHVGVDKKEYNLILKE